MWICSCSQLATVWTASTKTPTNLGINVEHQETWLWKLPCFILFYGEFMVVMILEICQASSLACPAFLRNLVGSGQYIAPWNLRRKYKVLDYPSEASKVIIDKSPEIRYHHPSKVIDHQGWRVVFICPSLGWPLDPNSRESRQRAATGGGQKKPPPSILGKIWFIHVYTLYMFIQPISGEMGVVYYVTSLLCRCGFMFYYDFDEHIYVSLPVSIVTGPTFG